MKICVLGLDCAAPEIIFGDERLVNLRRLMDAGVNGRLESVYPPITVPAWMCMCTSQDPGSLGVYGFRNRVDHSYDKLGFANSASIKALAIWDQLAREGKRSIMVGSQLSNQLGQRLGSQVPGGQNTQGAVNSITGWCGKT